MNSNNLGQDLVRLLAVGLQVTTQKKKRFKHAKLFRYQSCK